MHRIDSSAFAANDARTRDEDATTSRDSPRHPALRQAARLELEPGIADRAPPLRRREGRATPAASIRSRRASCRSVSARRPRSPACCSARARPTSPSAGSASRPTPTTPKAASCSERPVPAFDDATLDAALAALTGRITQTPPVYSAIKRGGEPLYRLARRGETVEAPPREVDVARLRASSNARRRPAPSRRMRLGHLRAQPRARSRRAARLRRARDGAAAALGRAVHGAAR